MQHHRPGVYCIIQSVFPSSFQLPISTAKCPNLTLFLLQAEAFPLLCVQVCESLGLVPADALWHGVICNSICEFGYIKSPIKSHKDIVHYTHSKHEQLMDTRRTSSQTDTDRRAHLLLLCPALMFLQVFIAEHTPVSSKATASCSPLVKCCQCWWLVKVQKLQEAAEAARAWLRTVHTKTNMTQLDRK